MRNNISPLATRHSLFILVLVLNEVVLLLESRRKPSNREGVRVPSKRLSTRTINGTREITLLLPISGVV